MQIATLIFTYNRSIHTEKVLKALSQNNILPEKLYVFQDGLKVEEHREEWEKVNKLIHRIDWCQCEIIESKNNKGLADSIVYGVNYVLQHYDAVIVLEDDCVPSTGFMAFMMQALNKYQYNKQVYSVTGYAYPVDVQANGTDAYFLKRVSSWGWGTWKNQWSVFERDYRILGRIKNNDKLTEQLHIWGEDLECYLLGNIYGSCNSWAVFWALNVIEQGGYSLSPYKSLIRNIGLDGSGVHCGKVELVQDIDESNEKEFCFPDKVAVPSNCEKLFSHYFSWVSAEKKLNSYNSLLIKWVDCLINNKTRIGDTLIERDIYKCSIWGKGRLCDLLLEELHNKVEVLSIVQTYPDEEDYKGIPIVDCRSIPVKTQLIIVIPIYDFDKISKLKEVSEYDIKPLDYFFE